MTMDLGLRPAEKAAYIEALSTTHLMRSRVAILDLDGEELADVTGRLQAGQVDVDASAATTRAASITLDDPDHSLHFDSNAPGDGAVHADRMIQATYGVYVPPLERWVDCDVFTGPVVSMGRNGATVELGCLGKEHLASGSAWDVLTLKGGMDIVEAIRIILKLRGGEARLVVDDVPERRARLPKGGLSLGPMSNPWAAAVRLAASIGRELYFDGSGVCRLRKIPGGGGFRFTGSIITSDPKVTYDLASVKNAVRVKGKKGGKGKDPVTARAVAPRFHPLSPTKDRFGRWVTHDGQQRWVGRYLALEIDNDKIDTKREAQRIADRTLDRALVEGVSVEFDALPLPFLDPNDRGTLDTPDVSLTFALRRFSIPLTHDGAMSVGTNKRVSRRKGQ